MTPITYQKFDDYYVFSHEPKTRVYLGDNNPEDYIWDELEQEKRSASCAYVHNETGERLKWEELSEDQQSDLSLNDIYEYTCDYYFERKTHLASMGSPTKKCKYVSKDKSVERLAWSWYFNQTLEKYDSDRKEFADQREKDARAKPYLHNLMWVSGEMYYVNDNGDRITHDEHVSHMKAKFGEDVFELANTYIDHLK